MTADESGLGELIVTRIYEAPRELVWACMTTPDHLTHFWGPPGMSTPIDGIVIELREGGRFETVMVNDATGESYPTTGVYVEIDPPNTLVWAEKGFAEGMTSTSTFTDLGNGRTEVVIHQRNVPAAFRSPEAQQGFNASLDRFTAYLATLV
ncbi:MAG: SRPBCC domain-containing protein [Actinobacteria bacterium]|jgi:uncharacterized protein YndB with AHSA1/START domain|nr:SRPBCC domain-containing protein [Actinomycetota bacterium]